MENAHVQDIQALDDEFTSQLVFKHGQFDKVFSNAVLHWCKRDPVGVIRSAKKVLKPSGVFAAEFGGWGNCIGKDKTIVIVRPCLIMRRRALGFTLGLASEELRPHRERSLVFPIDGILLKGTNLLPPRSGILC